ncbi:hypothetical protein Trydic_g13027 [Trypoxylus dichotomus]
MSNVDEMKADKRRTMAGKRTSKWKESYLEENTEYFHDYNEVGRTPTISRKRPADVLHTVFTTDDVPEALLPSYGDFTGTATRFIVILGRPGGASSTAVRIVRGVARDVAPLTAHALYPAIRDCRNAEINRKTINCNLKKVSKIQKQADLSSDVETLRKQLLEAHKTIEEYKIKLRKKELETDRHDQAHLAKIEEFYCTRGLKINPRKTQAITFTRTHQEVQQKITVAGTEIEWTGQIAYLGVIFETNI